MRLTTPFRWLAAAALAVLIAAPALAGRGDDADRKSKNGRTAGTAGGAEVVLEYGRPKVAGREVWGGLVPYGKVWRTGADEATTIRFDRDVTVEGEALAAGTYALFTVPGEKTWTVIFNRQAEQWGAFRHDPAQDGLRVEVAPERGEHVEELDFVVADGRVVLRWDELRVPVEVAAAGG